MKAAIDTNVFTALMRGDQRVRERLQRLERLLVSAVVIGELLYGFRHGSRYHDNRELLESFLGEPYVDLLTVGMITCDRYGLIAAALRVKGTPIPQNDVWIAAHALEHGVELISFDRHFERVDGLSCFIIADA